MKRALIFIFFLTTLTIAMQVELRCSQNVNCTIESLSEHNKVDYFDGKTTTFLSATYTVPEGEIYSIWIFANDYEKTAINTLEVSDKKGLNITLVDNRTIRILGTSNEPYGRLDFNIQFNQINRCLVEKDNLHPAKISCSGNIRSFPSSKNKELSYSLPKEAIIETIIPTPDEFGKFKGNWTVIRYRNSENSNYDAFISFVNKVEEDDLEAKKTFSVFFAGILVAIVIEATLQLFQRKNKNAKIIAIIYAIIGVCGAILIALNIFELELEILVVLFGFIVTCYLLVHFSDDKTSAKTRYSKRKKSYVP